MALPRIAEPGAPAAAKVFGPIVPRPFRVLRVRRDLSDTFTMELASVDGEPCRFIPGQFNMLYCFGVGDVPISISGDPGRPEVLVHTTRVVGAVTEAIGALKPGDTIGVRGPFGTPWPIEEAKGEDVVFIAGGIGLAPLRPAILQVLAERQRYGNVLVLYGARTPQDILYRSELQRWRSRFDVSVHVTVDRATGRWNGKIGVVTKLIKGGGFDHHNAVALICGPEVMMRFSIAALQERGLSNQRIFVSMERNMKCAIGQCGHCQFGPNFPCKDGPVFSFDRIEAIFPIPEL